MSRWYWYLSQTIGSLWFRASLYGVVAVITALVSIYFSRYVPENISHTIGADAVDSILHILASSMLAVTIFSVSTMVSAYSAATTNVTPRATRLLIEDKLSHKALSTFLGTFIYSIVGIIALQAGIYGTSGRFILYLVTIVIVVIIIFTLIRWIEYLSRLGRVGETILRVEEAAIKSLQERMRLPYMGAVHLKSPEDIPTDSISIFPNCVGYIQHIDMGALSNFAEEHDLKIYVQAMPGTLIDPGLPIAYIGHGIDAEDQKAIQDAFIIGKERSFRQDPRYGLVVLSEIATRALSPAVNDAGTAIQVIGVGLRVLSEWASRDQHVTKDEEIKYRRVYAPSLKIKDMFEDFFAPIAEAGAGISAIGIRMQKALLALDRTGDPEIKRLARQYAETGVQRGLLSLALTSDKALLEKSASILIQRT